MHLLCPQRLLLRLLHLEQLSSLELLLEDTTAMFSSYP